MTDEATAPGLGASETDFLRTRFTTVVPVPRRLVTGQGGAFATPEAPSGTAW